MLPPREPFTHAEERRLFYVALTRARTRSYVLADRSKSSAFIKELSEDFSDSVIIEDTDGPAGNLKKTTCTACRTGTLNLKEGANGNFLGCSNYPRCKHTEQTCPSCQAAALAVKNGKGSCSSCDAEVEICPQCLSKGLVAQLVHYNGSYGSFLGCANYRGKEGYTCRYTKNLSSDAPTLR